jgi:gamma-glutamyltranspeptidase/glutathione hydrolase
MVVSTDSLASAAGLSMLQAGGNAVDAAVATHFALAVVNPEAGNIGGGGFMVARMADETRAALDFREKAPLAASADMFLDADGRVTDAGVIGHLASGVPGSVAGMREAWSRFGTLPWSDLLQPAIRLARDGFVIGPRHLSSVGSGAGTLERFPSTAAVFLPEGEAPRQGSVFRQPDLARALEAIAIDGAAAFYRGWIADSTVAEMERGGGLITHEDLAAYEAVWRDPVVLGYRGYDIITMPPPSSGGVTMGQILNIVESFDLASPIGTTSSATRTSWRSPWGGCCRRATPTRSRRPSTCGWRRIRGPSTACPRNPPRPRTTRSSTPRATRSR